MKERTTAETIGSFHKELISQGIDSALAHQITLRAAQTLIEADGISIKKESANG